MSLDPPHDSPLAKQPQMCSLMTHLFTIAEQLGNLGESHENMMRTHWEQRQKTNNTVDPATKTKTGPLMSACWALAWLASKFDFQKCLSWGLAWANDKGINCGTLPHAPRKAMFEGNGRLWKLLGVDLHFMDLCMKYSWDGDHIFSLLLGMWYCAFRVYKTKTIGWNLSVSQALWHSFFG